MLSKTYEKGCATCKHAHRIDAITIICNSPKYDIKNLSCYEPKGLKPIKARRKVTLCAACCEVVKSHYNYCHRCGQAINWGADDE